MRLSLRSYLLNGSISYFFVLDGVQSHVIVEQSAIFAEPVLTSRSGRTRPPQTVVVANVVRRWSFPEANSQALLRSYDQFSQQMDFVSMMYRLDLISTQKGSANNLLFHKGKLLPWNIQHSMAQTTQNLNEQLTNQVDSEAWDCR